MTFGIRMEKWGLLCLTPIRKIQGWTHNVHSLCEPPRADQICPMDSNVPVDKKDSYIKKRNDTSSQSLIRLPCRDIDNLRPFLKGSTLQLSQGQIWGYTRPPRSRSAKDGEEMQWLLCESNHILYYFPMSRCFTRLLPFLTDRITPQISAQRGTVSWGGGSPPLQLFLHILLKFLVPNWIENIFK